MACTPETGLGPVERARRFYVRARQTRTGLAQTASAGRWAHCILTSRSGMAGAVSRWLGSIEGLAPIIDRLMRVQIDNAPALEVIQRYDTPETLFYLDPPYVHDSRGDTHAYHGEMSDVDHIELAQLLHAIKGRAAISGYRSDLYDSIYSDWYQSRRPRENLPFGAQAPPGITLDELRTAMPSTNDLAQESDSAAPSGLEILRSMWNDVLGNPAEAPDPTIDQLIRCPVVSIRYALLTQLLGKAVDESRDALSIQRGDASTADESGRWDARSFCSANVVPWVNESGQVLGTSPDPYVNNPLRRPRLDVPGGPSRTCRGCAF